MFYNLKTRHTYKLVKKLKQDREGNNTDTHMHTEFAEKAIARNQAVALGFKIQRSAIVIADAYLNFLLIYRYLLIPLKSALIQTAPNTDTSINIYVK